jgi:hypothetical protein
MNEVGMKLRRGSAVKRAAALGYLTLLGAGMSAGALE